MRPSARIQTAAGLLDQILEGEPAEKVLTNWARKSRFAGSKDRAAVRDLVYGAVRCKRSFAARGGAMTGRGLMIGGLRASNVDLATIFTGDGYGPAPLSPEEQQAGYTPEKFGEKFDIPEWLVPDFVHSLGDKAENNAEMMQSRAPVFLRVNLSKTSIEDVIESLGFDGVTAQKHPISSTALEVTIGSRRIKNCEAYIDGHVELQDGASQALVDQIELRTGYKVLDYCAGGGGKALAIVAKAGRDNHVTVFASDIDVERMKDLPLRAQRAGVNVAVIPPESVAENGPYDIVLCDVPCSGSGAWRRSPEGKWALTKERLVELNNIQAAILDQAQALLKPDGVLVYATCSALAQENGDVAQAFLKRNVAWKQVFTQQWAIEDGADGFFTAHFTRE